MNLADVLTVVLIIIGLLTVFVALWLAVAGLFPGLVERCAERLGAAPIKCALIGPLVAAPWLAIAVVVGKAATNAPGKLLSVTMVILVVLAALAGASGLALRIGRGLAAERDAREPWRRMLRGGIVLALTFLTVVVLPVTLLAGLGALVLAGRRREGAAAIVTPEG